MQNPSEKTQKYLSTGNCYAHDLLLHLHLLLQLMFISISIIVVAVVAISAIPSAVEREKMRVDRERSYNKDPTRSDKDEARCDVV